MDVCLFDSTAIELDSRTSETFSKRMVFEELESQRLEATAFLGFLDSAQV